MKRRMRKNLKKRGDRKVLNTGRLERRRNDETQQNDDLGEISVEKINKVKESGAKLAWQSLACCLGA